MLRSLGGGDAALFFDCFEASFSDATAAASGTSSAADASVVADITFTTKANERNSAMGGAMGVQCVCEGH